MSTVTTFVCHEQSAELLARRWQSSRTVYQLHASWHEAARIDGRRFDAMVKFFAGLRRGARPCFDCLPRAA